MAIAGPLWRLTRNRYGRACYEWLGRRGVTATRMYEYVALARPDLDVPDPAGDVALAAFDPTELDRSSAPFDELLDEECVVGALDAEDADGIDAGSDLLGYLFLSPPELDHVVAPLEASLSFDGSYVRRVFVDPAARRRGIATALVALARRTAAERFGADRAVALVAADNRPSRRAFEGNGFAARRVRTYARVGPWSRRSTRELD